MPRTKTRERPLIGWREWVALPDLSDRPLKAKVDTGARTSSLHAFGLRLEERADGTWAVFEIHPIQRSKQHSQAVTAPVVAFRRVRSSSGHSEQRPVIRTPAGIGSRKFDIEITLTSRDEMDFRMLLGRSAVRGRFWVDPGRSFILSEPTRDRDQTR